MDGLGNPLHVHLTAGNIHDATEGPKLAAIAQGDHFIGDKAYDSDAILSVLEAKGTAVVIPAGSGRIRARPIDQHVYKERHLVENFFCKIKRYRRVATRYDKHAVNYLGFVLVASVMVWLA